MTHKPLVAVVFGGRSSEHAISCVTAGSVMAAIDRTKYDVVPVGIARDGRWVLESSEPDRLAITSREVLPEVNGAAAPVSFDRTHDGTQLVTQSASDVPMVLGQVDVVFPVLHGPWGEDGTIQGLFEMAGVRYVGAGVLASAVSMDKGFMKVVLRAAGLPVLDWVVITGAEWAADPDACHQRAEANVTYPLFVKPCRAGSSMGISKVHSSAEFAAAMELALEHDPRVLVEAAALDAREVECGVLGRVDGGADASVCAEIRIGDDHEFYDFAAKYLPGETTQLDVPAQISEELSERLRTMAVDVFHAVGAEGLARVDFFVLPDESVLVNELNTMPGFTPTSMFPLMWAATGVDYPTLVDRLLTLALSRSTGLR
jgi:D-alanine-D-alanine ligase